MSDSVCSLPLFSLGWERGSCPVLCHEKGSASFTWQRKGLKSSGRDAGEKSSFHGVCSCSQVHPGKEATRGRQPVVQMDEPAGHCPAIWRVTLLSLFPRAAKLFSPPCSGCYWFRAWSWKMYSAFEFLNTAHLQVKARKALKETGSDISFHLLEGY